MIFALSRAYTQENPDWVLVPSRRKSSKGWSIRTLAFQRTQGGFIKDGYTAPEYSTGEVQERDRRCKESIPNDLVHLTLFRIPLINPP